MDFSLIRAFTPSPDVDWQSMMPLEPSALALGYADKAVNEEFLRFQYRDMASIVCGLIFGVGGAFYSAVYVWHVSPTFRAVNYTGGVIALIAAIADVYLLSCGKFSPQRARLRQLIAVAYALVCLSVTSYSIPQAFATCDEAVDYAAYLYSRQNATSARVTKYCIDVTNSYVTVCLSIAFSTIRLNPLATLLLSVLHLSLYYVGYSIQTLPGETAQDIVAKLLVYLVCLASSVALSTTRFRILRAQFEESVNAAVESKRAAAKNGEVETLLSAMVPESVLHRIVNKEAIHDRCPSATVLFTDIAGFTAWSSTKTAASIAAMLNCLCTAFDRVAQANRVERIKTIGDAYWAVCGLPDHVPQHGITMCSFATTLVAITRRETNRNPAWQGIRLRLGVDSGSCEGTIFGISRISYEVFGDASDGAHLAEQHGVPMRVCLGPGAYELMLGIAEMEPHTKLPGGGAQLYLLTQTFPAFDVTNTDHAATGSTQMNSSMQNSSFHSAGSSVRRAAADRVSNGGSAQNKYYVDDKSNANGKSAFMLMGKSKKSDAERNKALFLAQRVARAELHEHNMDAAATEEKLSSRFLPYVVLAFQDPEVEREYHDAVRPIHKPLCLAARVAMSGTCLVLMLAAFISSRSYRSYSTAAAVLMPASFVLSIVSTACACRDLLPATVEALLLHVAAVVLIVGCGLLDDSVVGNDLTYLHPILTSLLTFGITALPSIGIIVLNLVCIVGPIAYFVFDSVTWTADIGFLLLSLFFASFGAFISEKLFRRQFIETKLAQFQREEQHSRIKEQEAILAAILPHFVIRNVIEWVESGFDAEHTVLVYVRPGVVGFVSLKPGRTRTPQQQEGALIPLAASRDPGSARRVAPAAGLRRGSVLPDDDSPLPGQLDAPPPLARKATAAPNALFDSAQFEDVSSESLSDNEGGDEYEWLIQAHRDIDRALQSVGDSAIAKIKTIGDMILFAGPFTPQSSEGVPASAATCNGRQACAEMLSIIVLLRRATAANVTAGLHLGSFVGTVLGTNRLCFDIFGDGVNTASRVLSCGISQMSPEQLGCGVIMSEPFVACLIGRDGNADLAMTSSCCSPGGAMNTSVIVPMQTFTPPAMALAHSGGRSGRSSDSPTLSRHDLQSSSLLPDTTRGVISSPRFDASPLPGMVQSPPRNGDFAASSSTSAAPTTTATVIIDGRTIVTIGPMTSLTAKGKGAIMAAAVARVDDFASRAAEEIS